ncbi:MAG: isochorismatase [Anaerolinea sp.]|nr:isochorismatase [Anaerolinea sp.]
MKPALLVIDVQKKFFERDAVTRQSLNYAVENINEAIKLFRKRNLPIVFVQHIDEEDGLIPGTEGFELPDEFEVLPTDLRTHKTYGNSFHQTLLQKELKDQGVDTLILTGFCAEYCVLSTYRGAYDVDLMPIMLAGSLASVKPENIKFVESISEVISLGILNKFLTG